jgi:hypothetical protein
MYGDPLDPVSHPSNYPLFVVDGATRQVGRLLTPTHKQMEAWRGQVAAVSRA